MSVVYRGWCYLDWLYDTDNLVIAKRWLRRHMRTCPRGPLRSRVVAWKRLEFPGMADAFWVPLHLDDAPFGHKVVGPGPAAISASPAIRAGEPAAVR